MDVKIDSNYTPAEVQALLASLVSSGFLTPADLTQQADRFKNMTFCFLSINSLLLPFSDKFVWVDEWQTKTLLYELGKAGYYTFLTEQLLQACPLASFQATCQVEVEPTPASAKAILRAGTAEASFYYADYGEYMTRMLAALNTLLATLGIDAGYYEIEYDENIAFLLLSALQYEYLLTKRIVRFMGVRYPEIEAWRAQVRKEDLPF
jgi:hypothetical protein